MTSLLKAPSMKEDTEEETTMDNQDNEQNELEQEALQHVEMYAYNQACTQAGNRTDSITPYGVPFFALRMKNGDIYNLTGMHSERSMVLQEAIGRDRRQRYVMNVQSAAPIAYYQHILNDPKLRKKTFGTQHHGKHYQVVVVEMKQFTSHAHNGGHYFYTTNWSDVLVRPITPLVNVLHTCTDIDFLSDSAIHTMRGYVFVGEEMNPDWCDLTEVMA